MVQGIVELERRSGWRSRFAAEMDRQRRMGFEWGSHDCFSGLVVGAVRAITGEDIGAGFRGRYNDEAGAQAVLAADGFADLGDLVASLLPTREHPSQARLGDVGLIPAPGLLGSALCVFDSGTLIVLTARGHGRAARELAFRAFRVGDEV